MWNLLINFAIRFLAEEALEALLVRQAEKFLIQNTLKKVTSLLSKKGAMNFVKENLTKKNILKNFLSAKLNVRKTIINKFKKEMKKNAPLKKAWEKYIKINKKIDSLTSLEETFKKEAKRMFNDVKKYSKPIKRAQKDYQKKAKQIEEKGKLVDSAPLNSSWLLHGTWKSWGASLGRERQMGTLFLTVKIARRRKKKIVGYMVGKTYTYFNVSLATWTLMKEAVGGYLNGAGTVFWHSYLKGHDNIWGAALVAGRKQYYGLSTSQ